MMSLAISNEGKKEIANTKVTINNIKAVFTFAIMFLSLTILFHLGILGFGLSVGGVEV